MCDSPLKSPFPEQVYILSKIKKFDFNLREDPLRCPAVHVRRSEVIMNWEFVPSMRGNRVHLPHTPRPHQRHVPATTPPGIVNEHKIRTTRTRDSTTTFTTPRVVNHLNGNPRSLPDTKRRRSRCSSRVDRLFSKHRTGTFFPNPHGPRRSMVTRRKPWPPRSPEL